LNLLVQDAGIAASVGTYSKAFATQVANAFCFFQRKFCVIFKKQNLKNIAEDLRKTIP
jgi:hypothetical protein